MSSSVQSRSNSCRPVATRLHKPNRRSVNSFVCGNGADANWTGAFKITQEATGVSRRLVVVNADKNPACGSVNRD